MVHIPLETLIKKIIETTGLSRAEIDTRIAEKLEEFSGLISKEGAAHIVANELQVPIGDMAAGPYKINELKLGMRNITVIGKVLTKYQVTSFSRNGRDGRVASILFADQTGSIRVAFWHDDVFVYERLMENEVVSLSSLTVKDNRSQLELTASSQTKIVKNPTGFDAESFAKIVSKQSRVFAGVSASSGVASNGAVGEGTNGTNSATTGGFDANSSAQEGAFVPRAAAVRKYIDKITVTDPAVEILGVIVQVFKPISFIVDKSTGKKVRLEPGMPADQLHHEQRFVMTVVVDDGTETMRAVFFGDECVRLASGQSLATMRESEFEFSRFRVSLLGRLVKLTARVTQNQLYNRTELVVRTFELDPAASDELIRLASIKPAQRSTSESASDKDE